MTVATGAVVKIVGSGPLERVESHAINAREFTVKSLRGIIRSAEKRDSVSIGNHDGRRDVEASVRSLQENEASSCYRRAVMEQ